MNINYEYYKVFYYVAAYKNISLAAATLHYNQPNMTRTVKKLEEALGCTLFKRSHKGVSLTPEGEKLFEHIKIAVMQIETAESELESETLLRKGSVTVGATEVALRTFLLPVLNKFRNEYPGIKLKISNYTTTQTITALKNGIVDIAAVTSPTGDISGLKATVLKRVKEIAVGGEYYRELSKKKTTIFEIADYPIISLGQSSMTYELYRNRFAEYDLKFSPTIEAATADQIIPLVKNNLGIGFVPESFLKDESEKGIYKIDLAQSTPERDIILLKRENSILNIAADRLYKMMTESASV